MAFELSGTPHPLHPSRESCVYCIDCRASLARGIREPVVVLFTLSPHQLSVLTGSEKNIVYNNILKLWSFFVLLF